jgi:hypothetical protein
MRYGWWLRLLLLMALAGSAAANPPVRTVTAFVELDPAHYEVQFAQLAAGLHQSQTLFEQAGFEVHAVPRQDAPGAGAGVA